MFIHPKVILNLLKSPINHIFIYIDDSSSESSALRLNTIDLVNDDGLVQLYYSIPGSIRSVQSTTKHTALKDRLNKKEILHPLRHSCATHLADSGVGLNIIKELLGHKDIKTTMIYTQISNHTIRQVKSPLDTMGIQTRKWEQNAKP